MYFNMSTALDNRDDIYKEYMIQHPYQQRNSSSRGDNRLDTFNATSDIVDIGCQWKKYSSNNNNTKNSQSYHDRRSNNNVAVASTINIRLHKVKEG